MKSPLFAFLAMVLACSGLFAQAQNDALYGTVVNGIDGPSPNAVLIITPGDVQIVTSSASPNVPYALVLGAAFAPATLDFTVIQIDVSSPQIILDGISPVTFLDLFGNTGPGGQSTLTFPVGINVPNGVIGALQSVGLEPTAPFGVADSSTAVITVDDPCDYGTVTYGAGPNISSHGAAFIGSTGTAGTFPGLVDYDMQSIDTNAYNEFIANSESPGNIRREQFPALAPASTSENTSFEYVRTLYGDLYHFEDNLTGEFGFMLVNGSSIAEIPGTRMTNGGSATSPWEIEVGISNDQTTLAAVFDPTSGNDQVFLIKLDGTMFPGGGSIVDVTPTTGPTAINEESLTMVNGNFYFTDGTADGFLYRVDMANPAPGTILVLPNLGAGLPSLLVDGEMFHHAPSQQIFLAGGASSTARDLYCITAIGGGAEAIFNCSNFPTLTQIELFGDGWNGDDGRISVSPDGSRVAFVVQTSSTNEDVYWSLSNGSMVAQELTPDASFNTALDTAMDLNFYANDGLLFFFGTSTTLMDLYHADLSGPSPVYTNVTGTSGSTTVPFASGGAIDPDGYFTLADRMIFARDGTLTFGPSAGTTSGFNLVGVLYTGPDALTPYNITGDEWPTTVAGSGTTDNSGETDSTGTELVFSPTGTLVWFKASVQPSTADEDIWVFDAASTAPAFRAGMNASGSTIDNLRPDPSGFTCLFSYETTGDEEIYQAIFGLAGAFQMTDDQDSTSNDVTDGSIRYLDPAAACAGFVYAQGTNSTTNPTDAVLRAFDMSFSVGFDLSDVPSSYWVFGLSYP